MLCLATVGTSAITEKFLSACRLTDKYIFHTAYSRDKKRGEEFAEKEGFLYSCDDIYAVAGNPEIDAVYIASPNVFHYAQSKLFLSHGKHVICEKPITTRLAEYKKLYALAQEKNLVYIEAIMPIHTESRKLLKSAIEEIGNISFARIDFGQLSSRYDKFISGEQVNIFDMSLAAGALMDLGIYCVYGAVDLLGKPNNIKAAASFLNNGADGSGCVIFEYDSFTASITYSKTGQSAICTEIVGDKGALKIGSISQYGDISLVKNGNEITLSPLPSRAEVMKGEALSFAHYIDNYGETEPDRKKLHELTCTVHSCMDLIKQNANIKYNLKEITL